MKNFLVLSFLIFFMACVTKLAIPTNNDVERVKDKYPGYTLQELNEGEILYRQNCATCHSLKHPSSHTASEWEKIVPAEVIKVNKQNNNTIIDKEYQKVLLRYLVTMSTAP